MNKVFLTGKLVNIFPTEYFGETFYKRVFWLKGQNATNQTQHWEIELHNRDVSEIEKFKLNDTLTAEIEIRGNLSSKNNTEKVFNCLKCVGIKKVQLPVQTKLVKDSKNRY